MTRCFGWAMLIAIGMILGYAAGSHENTLAASATRQAAAEETDAGGQGAANQDDVVLTQLKEINNHLQRIDTLLYSDRLKVINVINPD